jgi:flagellar hook protein FlgE
LLDAPGTGARGSIASGALEASNVDLGNELVTLIAYQRAFQANAKTVTTADEMMMDVTNLKR